MDIRWIGTSSGLLGVLVAAACVPGFGGPPEEAAAVVRSYAERWSNGELRELAQLTDAPHRARKVIALAHRNLGLSDTRAAPAGELTCSESGGACRQQLKVTHTVAGLGRWTYRPSIELRPRGETWQVHWTPSTLHPKMTAKKRFRMVRATSRRASILDREGDPITRDRPVVRLMLDPAEVTSETYTALRQHLGLDPDGLRARVEDATGPVSAITVRDALWSNVAGHLEGLPGLVPEEDELSLAPTPTFARAVVGSLGPTTDKEILRAAGPAFLPTDAVGLSGLQRRFQQRLAGRPGGHIELYEPSTGEVTDRLASVDPRPGKPVRTTLDVDVQRAAEQALQDVEKPVAIVAVRASTGAVLAAANGPGVTSYNRAFVGRYPPGSTFKVVTSAALIERGLSITDTVECPKQVNVGGKDFRNSYHGRLADGPYWKAFAHSCNTTIVGRADTLSEGDLTGMAERFGIGATWKVGLPAYSGSVPVPRDLTERAASMIGQGRVLMSPLGMAMVAATVSSGQPRTPSLLATSPGREVGEKLPGGLRNDLHGLMRSVVTVGSGRGTLQDLPGGEVYAKTGTAEYGTEDPPRTHAWMIGFRDDLAFAVVIDDGGAGSKDAGPVARRFLQEAPVVR